MKSLVGLWIVCHLSLQLFNPVIKQTVTQNKEARCLVVDDRLDPVGTEQEPSYPMLVDCRKDIMWLEPKNSDGIFVFFKGTGECNE